MIKLGTKFKANYADSCSTWTVIKSRGHGAYICTILDDEDWKDQTKIFYESEIKASIAHEKHITDFFNASNAWLNKLVSGTLVHYHNGFEQYIRCEVIKVDGKTELKPIALVGKWDKHNLPQRDKDGSIYYPYHASKVVNGETCDTNVSNIYEYNPSKFKTDPNSMTPVDLSVPELDANEKEAARINGLVKQVQELVESDKTDTNKLNEIKALLEKKWK